MIRQPPPLAGILLAAFVAGCGPDYSPNTYAAGAVQQANKVEQGVVVGVRRVEVSASGTTGAVAGGAAGGIVGSQLPGAGVTTAIGTIGGGLIGGLVGTGIDKGMNDTSAYEYIVRKTNAELVSVTQRDTSSMGVGQHVLVIAGSQARIIPDYTLPPEPKPQPFYPPQPTETAPAPPPVKAEPLFTPAAVAPPPPDPPVAKPPDPVPVAPPPPPPIERQPTPPTPPPPPP